MRVVGRVLLAVAAVAFGLALPFVALAVAVPTSQLISVATLYKMGCDPPSTFVSCAPTYTDPRLWTATIWSDGNLIVSQVETTATEYPLSGSAMAMMTDMHAPACGDASGMRGFVDQTALLTDNQQISGTVGDCAVFGSIQLAIEGNPTYTVRSAVRTATPTPTPSATPTPRPTPTPTPLPSVRPTPTATRSAAASRTPAASATSSATSSPTATATATASATASSSATAPVSPTPEQEVRGGQSTPSAGPSGAPILQPSDIGVGSGRLAAALVAPAGVALEPGPLVVSALFAILLLLFMAFASELFNSTLESNYDEVAGWLRVWRRRAGGVARLWGGPLGTGLFLALGAAVYGLLDPTFGLDLGSLATLVGLLVGLVVVMISFELPGMLMYRRRTGALPGLRALPWTLAAAAVCVAISRIANLEPGYLYGLLLGLVFVSEPSGAEEGRQTAVGAAWTLGVALLGWVALTWVRGDPPPLTGFGGLAVETALAVIVVGGLEAVAFGLLPMRFLAGQALYRWSRPLWALLFGIGTFAFLYLLVGPHTGYLAELPLAGLMAAFGVFAVFGAISVLFWSYFRFRRERVAA